MKTVFFLTAMISLATLNAHAKATRLSPKFEKEVIELIENLGPDSWEEGDTDAKFDAVLYDETKETVFIIYEIRQAGSSLPYKKQKPITVRGIKKESDIVEQARNGYRSLSDQIVDAIFSNL